MYLSSLIMRLSIFIFKNKRTKMILYYNFNLFLIAIEIKPLLKSHISSYEVMIATICWWLVLQLHAKHFLTLPHIVFIWTLKTILQMRKWKSTREMAKAGTNLFLVSSLFSWLLNLWNGSDCFCFCPLTSRILQLSLLLCIIFYK